MISSSVRHDFLLILSELNHVTQLQEKTIGGWTIGLCKTSDNNGLLVYVSIKCLCRKATERLLHCSIKTAKQGSHL